MLLTYAFALCHSGSPQLGRRRGALGLLAPIVIQFLLMQKGEGVAVRAGKLKQHLLSTIHRKCCYPLWCSKRRSSAQYILNCKNVKLIQLGLIVNIFNPWFRFSPDGIKLVESRAWMLLWGEVAHKLPALI